jgi:cephalosporin-C deacetylase
MPDHYPGISGVRKLFLRAALFAWLCPAIPLAAWDRASVAYEKGYGAKISPLLPDSSHILPASPGGPTLRLRIKNTHGGKVSGAMLYVGITDFQGRGVQDFDRRVELPGEEATELEFRVASLANFSGFYDVRVLLFDHGRELCQTEFTFGYAVDSLPVRIYRPPDFDRFWQSTLDSLHAGPLGLTCRLDSLRSDSGMLAYRVSYLSLHGVRVYGWLTVPRNRPGPYPALLDLPGYATGIVHPNAWYTRLGYATLSIQVRGYEVDRESYPPDNSSYVTLGIESPETYVYREIICHCLRGVDLLAGRPEVDSTRIGVVGGSQGGGLALLTAGLDSRVRMVSAGVPFLTDFPLSIMMSGNPYRNIAQYLEKNPESRERVIRTLSFVDALNLADRIHSPVILSAGLFDRTCPAPSIYTLYLALTTTEKKIRIYPYLDHGEVHGRHWPTERKWMLDHLPPDSR